MAKFGYIRDRSALGYVAGLLFELDGGDARAVYLVTAQYVDGGDANDTYLATQFINCGNA
jgi:hypothetical protein